MSLYDQRTVTEQDMAHGFLDYDLGTPTVDAVANIAHQYHPQMELLTYHARFCQSHLTKWKAGLKHAVFLCVDSMEMRRSLWQWVSHRAQFLCDGHLGSDAIRVVSTERPAKHTGYPSNRVVSEKPPGKCASDVVSASLAAGFMVGQFTRWVRRLPCIPEVELNLFSWELVVQKASR